MKHALVTLITLLAAFTVSGCDQGDERLQEKARIEGEETARRQIDAENENKLMWTEAAEKELALRHRFYQAVSGIYEGVVSGNGTTFNIRFNISPSLPPLPESNRTRTLEEVTAELNNLFLSVHVTEWTERGMGFGCVFEHIRPDMVNGKISLFSEECQRTFRISFSDKSWEIDPQNLRLATPAVSRDIARSLRSGDQVILEAFSGMLQASLGASLYKFQVQKIVENVN